MKQKTRKKRKLSTPKSILRLPDLEAARSAVLNSLSCPDAQRGYRHGDRLKGKRDRALLAVPLACGLRRHELAGLTASHLQQREGHWAIVDLRGKAGHVRTIPVPEWVQGLLDDWTKAAGIATGSLFRRVSSTGRVWGERVTEKLVWPSVSTSQTCAASSCAHPPRRHYLSHPRQLPPPEPSQSGSGPG
jgi:site-specific recombinase XerC